MTRGLADWRESILQQTLWTTAILAGIAYVPGVTAAWSQQLWSVVIIDTVVWLLVLLLALWRSLPFNLRAAGFVTIWYVFAFFLLWTLGPVGAGIAWLLAVPIMAALFFGFSGAVGGITATLAGCLAFGLLLPTHQQGPAGAIGPTYDMTAWLGSSGSLIFLAALLSLSIARLLRGLESSMDEQDSANRRLSEVLNERQQLQAQLLHTQKQSALGTLASGIAHDFNNLLVPILMASEEARDAAPAGSRSRQQLESVIQSALRARDLIRRILMFSRSNEAERRPVMLEPVLREVGALLRSSAPAGIRFEIQLDVADAHVMADPGELHQIIMNLGTNAILAMKDSGGTMRLTAQRETSSNQCRIDISDTGPGIPDEIAAKIFEPFFSTRDPGTGTGLGLAIVDSLTNGMGGTVAFESQRGRGTCFTLHFPEVLPDGQRAELVAAPHPADGPVDAGPAATNQAVTVLVVDDEELVRATTAMILQRQGYRVIEAATPESALRRLHDDETPIDVLVTDQAMPGMSGLTLVEHVRALRADLPVLLCSGHLDQDEYARVEELGVDAVLIKPFPRRVLLEHVERLQQQAPDMEQQPG